MANNITAEHIGNALGGKRTSTGWLCNCVSHADSTPSLAVSESPDGKILVKCFAGCTQEAVMDGLKSRALWPSAPLAILERKSEYVYSDINGLPALKVTRIDRGAKKQIFQAHMKDGRWTSGGFKGDLRPYRFEQWQRESGRRIFIVEGEKCADALVERGLLATTTPGGSQAWRESFAKSFEGRHVVILPDEDTPGREYAANVYRDIQNVAASVIVIELPGLKEKEDVYDWFASGRSVDELKDLVDMAPTLSPRMLAALATNATPAPIVHEPDEVPLVSLKKDPWPSAMQDEAYHGIAGEFVRSVEPMTEADNAAILIQFLVGFGNMIGRSPYVMIGAGKHHTNLFATLVGNSGIGRKGTAWDLVKLVLFRVDAQWKDKCMLFGLGSGEGLVAAVKDPEMPSLEEMAKSQPKFEEPKDKRAMVTEGEFGQVLKVFQREGGTLSPQIRNAWDSGDLRVTTKKNSLKATDAHVSIIGHITSVELKLLLSTSDMFNGIGNRFMWICTTRSKLIPRPRMPNPDVLDSFIAKVSRATTFARSQGEMMLSSAAVAAYCEVYEALSRPRPGIIGTLTARAPATIQRIAMIYALLDESAAIELEHLHAALAIWEYAEQSAIAIFGKQTGNRAADKLLEALTAAENGLTQTEIITDVFGKNIKKADLTNALTLLSSYNLVTASKEKAASSNRQVVRWRACLTNYEFNEPSHGAPARTSSNSYFVQQKQIGGVHVS